MRRPESKCVRLFYLQFRCADRSFSYFSCSLYEKMANKVYTDTSVKRMDAVNGECMLCAVEYTRDML